MALHTGSGVTPVLEEQAERTPDIVVMPLEKQSAAAHLNLHQPAQTAVR